MVVVHSDDYEGQNRGHLGGVKDGKDHFLQIQYGYHVRGAVVFGWKRGCY